MHSAILHHNHKCETNGGVIKNWEGRHSTVHDACMDVMQSASFKSSLYTNEKRKERKKEKKKK